MATSLLATVASRALQRSAGSPAASLSAALGATAGCRWFSSALPDPIPPSDEIEMKGIKLKGRPVYLDMQATTPMDPRVLDAMLPFFTEQFGNPHSRTHLYGWESEDAVETARKNVANVIGADPKEIIFTSGATESNNIAVKGIANFYKEKKNHVITTQTDHKCVLDSCRYLQQRGWDVSIFHAGQIPQPPGLWLTFACRKGVRNMSTPWTVACRSFVPGPQSGGC